MQLDTLTAISPIDGRYRSKCEPLADYFSEFALIRYRVRVEVEYFIALCEIPLPQLAGVDHSAFTALRAIYTGFTEADAAAVKEIERTTNHDVKAVEYFLKQRFDALGLEAYKEFIHFGLTSQDINNTAVPMSIREALNDVYLPLMERLQSELDRMASEWAEIPMLAKTHGQPASPTRLGKEMGVFAYRLRTQIASLKSVAISGKFGGATGNFNAHLTAFPAIDWQAQYISMEYFKQRIKEGEVGSSAMPHKVNPIDFENSEGNLGIADAIFGHLSTKLPISRLQRDLTDSTVLRNVGVPVAHTVIAVESTLKGLSKLILNQSAIDRDLDSMWSVVAEGIQTILRREGYPHPYETLKQLTRTNAQVTAESIAAFIDTLAVSDEVKQELRRLSPHSYTGY